MPKNQRWDDYSIKMKVREGSYQFNDPNFAQYNPKETPKNLAGPNDNMQTIKDFMKGIGFCSESNLLILSIAFVSQSELKCTRSV